MSMMSKRMKLSSKFQLGKHVDDDNDSFVDRISQLPDEILVTILSRLTLKEAAQSSIISQRWKKLWTFSNGNMDFDAPPVMFQLDTTYWDDKKIMLMKDEGKKFAKWVNQVLALHKSEVADGFKICFGLDNTHKRNLDRWVQVAIQKKKVNRLELLLHQKQRGSKVFYSLPAEILTYSSISLLRVFRISEVELSGPLLEGIMTKCPSLEEISVTDSSTLLGVNFCGINLKLIELRQCHNLKYMEIDAPNSMSFMYSGSPASIRIAHGAPKLHTMELGGCYSDDHFPMYPEVSSFFSQIETLTLDYGVLHICEVPPVFPEYKILKCLRLKLGTHDGKSLLSCLSMLKGCPMLHTLVVEFFWADKYIERKMEKIEGEELKCLKIVDLKWFHGRTADVELAISIIQNSPNLEKITFDPWCPISLNEQSPFGERCLGSVYDYDMRRINGRKCARQLAVKYCQHIQVDVL